MYCKYCGARLKEDDLFCWKCGEKISIEPFDKSMADDIKTCKRKSRRWRYVGVAAIVIILISVCIVALIENEKELSKYVAAYEEYTEGEYPQCISDVVEAYIDGSQVSMDDGVQISDGDVLYGNEKFYSSGMETMGWGYCADVLYGCEISDYSEGYYDVRDYLEAFRICDFDKKMKTFAGYLDLSFSANHFYGDRKASLYFTMIYDDYDERFEMEKLVFVSSNYQLVY